MTRPPASALMRPAMTHAECVASAASYIGKRYPVTLPEFYSYNAELPDVIGFGNKHSVVVECKVTRSDFQSDRNKLFRKHPEKGMGDYRYFCVPKGLVSVTELPKGWGLLYVYPSGQVREVKGSYWPPEPDADLSRDWMRGGRFPKNKDAEHHLLFYYARRAYYAGVHQQVLDYRGFDR